MKDQVLYHGTSSTRVPAILIRGLRAPVYLASRKIAEYYAGEDAEQEGGTPVVLTVKLADLDVSLLQPDKPGIEEPLTYTLGKTEAQVWRQWKASKMDWVASLRIIGSCRYPRAVAANAICLDYIVYRGAQVVAQASTLHEAEVEAKCVGGYVRRAVE